MVVRRVGKPEFLALIQSAAQDPTAMVALRRFVDDRYVGEEYDEAGAGTELDYQFESEDVEVVFDCVAYYLAGGEREERERWEFLARALQFGVWSSGVAIAALAHPEIGELRKKLDEGLILETVFRNGVSQLIPPVGGPTVDEVVETYAALQQNLDGAP